MIHTAQFLVFSDIHFAEHNQYANNDGYYDVILDNDIYYSYRVNGINSRLFHCMNAFFQVIDYAHKNHIKYVLFAGDLYHNKRNITKDTMNVVSRCFIYAQALGIEVICIPGNHDMVDKECINHSLVSLRSFPNVHQDEGSGYYQTCNTGANIYLDVNSVSYTEDEDCFITLVNHPKYHNTIIPHKNNIIFKVLLAHCGIQGAKVGTDYVMVKDHDLDIDDIDLHKYDACFFGHYHEHQKVAKNAWIVGATHEQNWSDVNGKRGFIHVTMKQENNIVTTQVVHIPTARTIPRFKLLSDSTDFSTLDIKPWDFIKYKVKGDITQDVIDNITGLVTIKCDGITPKYLEIVPIREENSSEDFVLSDKATSADSVLEEWVEHQKPDLPLDKVLQVGKELLNEARNSLI